MREKKRAQEWRAEVLSHRRRAVDGYSARDRQAHPCVCREKESC